MTNAKGGASEKEPLGQTQCLSPGTKEENDSYSSKHQQLVLLPYQLSKNINA